MTPSAIVPYLLLVTFLTPNLDSNQEIARIKALNDSPFQGVAVKLRGVYEIRPLRQIDFAPSVAFLKRECQKDIWPWIFLNRIIGYKEGEGSHADVKGQKFAEPFKAIKGLDVFNEAGALEDFYQTWRLSLRIARELGSPGVVLDPEAYNCWKTEDLGFVAREAMRSEQEVRQGLEAIGRQLAEDANRLHPEGTIWFLTTRLGSRSKSKKPEGMASDENDQVTFACIVMAMLERSKELHSKLNFVCGGAEKLGYCHKSLDQMVKKIEKRRLELRPFLDKYENLSLAGTLAPWDKPESKKGFFANNSECRDSDFRTLTDFHPVLKMLFTSYDYNWLYAGSSQWNPYDRANAILFNGALEKALGEARNAR